MASIKQKPSEIMSIVVKTAGYIMCLVAGKKVSVGMC